MGPQNAPRVTSGTAGPGYRARGAAGGYLPPAGRLRRRTSSRWRPRPNRPATTVRCRPPFCQRALLIDPVGRQVGAHVEVATDRGNARIAWLADTQKRAGEG